MTYLLLLYCFLLGATPSSAGLSTAALKAARNDEAANAVPTILPLPCDQKPDDKDDEDEDDNDEELEEKGARAEDGEEDEERDDDRPYSLADDERDGDEDDERKKDDDADEKHIRLLVKNEAGTNVIVNWKGIEDDDEPEFIDAIPASKHRTISSYPGRFVFLSVDGTIGKHDISTSAVDHELIIGRFSVKSSTSVKILLRNIAGEDTHVFWREAAGQELRSVGVIPAEGILGLSTFPGHQFEFKNIGGKLIGTHSAAESDIDHEVLISSKTNSAFMGKHTMTSKPMNGPFPLSTVRRLWEEL